jgi:flagellar biosynthesis/type III secretory pathway chaperone
MESYALNNIIVSESTSLKKLLTLLEKQHEVLIKNDVFKMDEIIYEIQLCNKEIAEKEVDRRNLVKDESMKSIVKLSADNTLENNYKNIQNIMNELKVQKEANEILIKMGLSFSTRVLNMLKPDRRSKTYNSYGKILK